MARHNYIFSSSNSNNNDRQSLAFESSASSSTPGLSFPLGTGLVVLIILVVSAIFSFCYHWLKLRKDATTISPTAAASSSSQAPPSTTAAQPTADDHKLMLAKLATLPCPPVVYMAGEDMPRFIALPCPHFVTATLKHTKETDKEKAACEELMAMDLKLDIRL